VNERLEHLKKLSSTFPSFLEGIELSSRKKKTQVWIMRSRRFGEEFGREI